MFYTSHGSIKSFSSQIIFDSVFFSFTYDINTVSN